LRATLRSIPAANDEPNRFLVPFDETLIIGSRRAS